MQLHDYQKEAIDFAIRKRATYQMIDLGLGKTAIALHAIQYVKRPALVLCPIKVGYSTWTQEIENWTPNLTYTILHGPHKDKRLRHDVDIFILPYSSLKWFYTRCCEHKFKLRKFFTVYDESTFIKSWSTDRWKKYVHRMLPINGMYRMCLSATPTPNGLIDLWTQYYVLDEGKTFGHYPTTYRDRFFHYTGPPRYQTLIKPFSQNQIYELISPITKRLSAKDYLNMPSITYNKVCVVTPPAVKKLYNQMLKEDIINLGGFDIAADSAGAKSNLLRQIAQGAILYDRPKYKVIHETKAQALKEMVEGLAGQPVLVPIHYRFDYDIICKVFKKQLPVIRGGVNETQSLSLIRQWNKGNIEVLLCHPGSIGHGVNLQAGGHNIIWYALPWSLDHFIQLNGRLHRQGQKHGVIVNALMLDLPIETRVFNVLADRNATQKDLLNAISQLSSA